MQISDRDSLPQIPENGELYNRRQLSSAAFLLKVDWLEFAAYKICKVGDSRAKSQSTISRLVGTNYHALLLCFKGIYLCCICSEDLTTDLWVNEAFMPHLYMVYDDKKSCLE